MANPALVNVGMARGPIVALTDENRGQAHDPLEAIALWLDDGSAPAVLIALDLALLSFPRARQVREELSARFGLPVDAIILHFTHTHTGARSGLENLGDVLGDLVQYAQRQAQPACIAYAEVDTEGRLNLNRRKILPLGLGVFTTFMGMVDHEGKPDGGPQNRLRLQYWRGRPTTEPELQQPMLYDDPVDSLVQGIFFRTPDGTPIGSLVRFACHPTPAGHTTKRMMSADFPTVTRERLREVFGGECLYLNGPCGNIAPWERGDWIYPEPTPETPEDFNPGIMWAVKQRDPDEVWNEVRRIGCAVAEAILAHVPSNEAFRPLTTMRTANDSLALPLRNDLPGTVEEIWQLRVETAAEFLRVRNTLPLPELKALSDRLCRLHLSSHRQNLYGVGPNRTVTVELPTLCLNDIILMGFPGESFWQTPQQARQAVLAQGMRYLSFTLANGSIGYIPTEADRPLGDYEVHSTILDDGAEAQLEQAARKLAERLLPVKQ